MTERDYLVSLGLAKAGARGRFSREAHAALEKARAEGKTFDQPVKPVASTPRSQATTLDKPKSSPKPSPGKGTYDAKAARKWAEERGLIKAGQRGRLPGDVLSDYLTQTGGKVEKPKPTPPKPKIKIRDQKEAWYLKPADPEKPWQTPILFGLGNCGRCFEGIPYCGCDGGPVGPKYMGYPTLSLTKP